MRETSTFKLYLDDEWVEFPESCLSKSLPARQREKVVLEVINQIEDPRSPRGFFPRVWAAWEKTYPTADVTYEALRSVIIRLRRRVIKWRDEQALSNTLLPKGKSADEKYRNWLGFTQPRYPARIKQESEQRRVILGADYHGHPHPKVVNMMLQEGVQAAGDVVFVHGGDLFDLFSTSGAGMVNGVPVHASEMGEKLFHEESTNLVSMFMYMTEHLPFARHYVVRGNHDAYTKLFNRTAYWIVREFIKDPLDAICQQFDQVQLVGQQLEYYEPDGEIKETFKRNNFMYVLGDLLVSHMNFTGKDAHRKLWGWVQQRRFVLNLNHIRIAMQAHVHRLILEDEEGGHVRIGMPGFAGDVQPLSYQYGYHPWMSEVSVGFIVLDQEFDGREWKTILNSVKTVRL